jgi:hypothetical protein
MNSLDVVISGDNNLTIVAGANINSSTITANDLTISGGKSFGTSTSYANLNVSSITAAVDDFYIKTSAGLGGVTATGTLGYDAQDTNVSLSGDLSAGSVVFTNVENFSQTDGKLIKVDNNVSITASGDITIAGITNSDNSGPADTVTFDLNGSLSSAGTSNTDVRADSFIVNGSTSTTNIGAMNIKVTNLSIDANNTCTITNATNTNLTIANINVTNTFAISSDNNISTSGTITADTLTITASGGLIDIDTNVSNINLA